MPELSKDVVALLQYLVPGFVVAWIYFGLTSHNKPSQFERVVQALIFTVVVQVVVLGEKNFLLWAGQYWLAGEWTENSNIAAAIFSALFLGVGIAWGTNVDGFHRLARKFKITSRTGHPCEWFGIFADYPRFVVLQLKDGTRIFGWPKVWPSEAKNGHFFMTDAVRVVDGEEQELSSLEGILIDVRDVSSVEFAKKPKDEDTP